MEPELSATGETQDSWDLYISSLPDDMAAPLMDQDADLLSNTMEYRTQGQAQSQIKVENKTQPETKHSKTNVYSNLREFLKFKDNRVRKSLESSMSIGPEPLSSDYRASTAAEYYDTPFSSDGLVPPDEHVSSQSVVSSVPSSLPAGIDAGDESLQRYKESLGLGGKGKDISDPNDPRVCIILSLTMDSEGRPPVTIDLSTKGAEATLKDKPFKIKEGVKFSMTAKFKVQHEILSGLTYVQIVKRKSVRVGKDQEMIGSYAPNTEQNPVYTKRFAEETAPAGMLARGHYTAMSTFIDDDKHKHLQFEWSFDISKDW